jgi:hypothetical protein
MSKENQEFFKLLKYSNELRKNKKSLFKEYPEKDKKLLQFLRRIEENLHLREKNTYIELMDIFLTCQINAEDFFFYFIAKYDDINKNLREMELNFQQKFDELSNLLLENKNNQYNIGISLMALYDECDSFDPNSNSSATYEANLRNSAKMLLSELKRT